MQKLYQQLDVYVQYYWLPEVVNSIVSRKDPKSRNISC